MVATVLGTVPWRAYWASSVGTIFETFFLCPVFVLELHWALTHILLILCIKDNPGVDDQTKSLINSEKHLKLIMKLT